MYNLEYWLRPIDEIFDDFRDFVLDADDNNKHRIFINNGSNILFVAHLDTVIEPELLFKGKKTVYASGLDDRLGCSIAYDLSQELGADLLLTDHEEKFLSTAAFHKCKDYNWIAEFDRAGKDVVTYNLDGLEFVAALSERWKVDIGTFSDIKELRTSACCVNIGIGYEEAHSKASYMVRRITDRQMELFKEFFQQHKDTKYVRDFQDDDYWTDENTCEFCGFGKGEFVFGYYICRDCFDSLVLRYV